MAENVPICGAHTYVMSHTEMENLTALIQPHSAAGLTLYMLTGNVEGTGCGL